jgi:putative ABC transport system permease protein
VNPRLLGVRLDMLLYLYRRRLRAHPAAELLAAAGVAVGVALVFGVLLANASLTGSAQRLIGGLVGSARYELAARSPAGMSEALVARVGQLEGVRVAAPALRENVTLRGPRGSEQVQLIGLTQSVEALGGAAGQELAAGALLLKGGLGLPSGVADRLGAGRSDALGVAGGGAVHDSYVRVVLDSSLAGVAASPVAVSLLSVAQRLSGHPGRVSEILVAPAPGATGAARARLASLAAANHLDLRPADAELGLLSVATKPNRQSTSLFTAIAVMIGFLLALNAVLLTVPERRRFIAELRMQGYDGRQVALLMGMQALALGLVASAVGIGLGYLLSALLFERVPGFLTAAFPIGAEETVGAGSVAAAVVCGVGAALLASVSPLLDLRADRPVEPVPDRAGAHGEALAERIVAAAALAGACLVAGAVALALLAPEATIAAGVALALAGVCLVPGVLWLAARALPRAAQRVRSGALIVALTETRAVTMRSVALAGIVCLSVYGGIAIGGARSDLLRGVREATDQYFASAPVWVTAGRDVFNTNSFVPSAAARAIARAPGVASVRTYRGSLLDVGQRRLWVRARPAGDGEAFEASQLQSGDYAEATRLIETGGWAAVSSDFAAEHGLKVGSFFDLPTPSGSARVGVAAITTNSGWPAGAITLGGAYYARLWGAGEAAALEVALQPGVTPEAGRRAVTAALGPASGLDVQTAAQRIAQSETSAGQGLRTLGEISTLLLLAAALSVASALSAAIWQRRLRLASLKMQGYDSGQLWRAVLTESAVTIGAGVLVGTAVGVIGHALAGRFLALTTGFPAPFALGPAQVLLTIALFTLTALAVVALPGMAAARVSPRAVLQE